MRTASTTQRTVDLHPSEWTANDRPSERRPREPFFGPGLWPWLTNLTCWFLVSWAVHAVLDPAFTPHQPKRSLPPGHYSWSPETGLTRLP